MLHLRAVFSEIIRFLEFGLPFKPCELIVLIKFLLLLRTLEENVKTLAE